ncbi:hypothetical protein PFISCL1PPCAC_19145, partial [Pristionchus fissidentatus]
SSIDGGSVDALSWWSPSSRVMRCSRGWPRLCRAWRLIVCLTLSFISACIVYSYCALTELNEPSPAVATALSTVVVHKTRMPDTTRVHLNTTECFPSKSELVDFPNCRSKWDWMVDGWRTDQCYAKMGVNGTGCSIRRFLSTAEKHCPPLHGSTLNESRRMAEPNFSMEQLFSKLTDKAVNYEFMKQRMSRMWDSWKEAYRENVRLHPKTMANRTMLKIVLHLGFLTNTKFGELSSKGGPLGELVQWSDLIASLHILGHDLRISTQPDSVLRNIDAFARLAPCPNGNQVDLIFTDIMGLRLMQRKRRPFVVSNKCKLRLLDSFGTQAEFNTREYFNGHKSELGKSNPWGGHGLALRQFLSLYPHTHDNTFLGFVVNTHLNGTLNKTRSGVLVYGKEKYMWAKAEAAVRTAMEVTEVHATVADASDASSLPSGVINHRLLNELQFHELLSKVRVFLGLGFPFEGPAPLEAVAHGAIFINPRFDPPKGRLTEKFFAEKPTLRALTSQCPYLEDMGEPWVMTVDTNDTKALKDAIERAMMSDVTPRLPSELTASGMLLRVSIIVDRLNTCETMPVWPPPSALRERVGVAGASCESVCSSAGLRCDSALFPLVNKKERLVERMKCESIATTPSIVAPSKCTLQENSLLFSCSSSLAGTIRLCPCRDFLPDQRELCTQCL